MWVYAHKPASLHSDGIAHRCIYLSETLLSLLQLLPIMHFWQNAGSPTFLFKQNFYYDAKFTRGQSIYLKIKKILYVCVHVCVYMPCAQGAHTVQKRASGSPGMELQAVQYEC